MPKAALLLAFLAFESISPASAQTAPGETDGKLLFAKCRACHSLEPGKHGQGPSLYGVIGRKAGSIPGFKFSQPLATKDIIWTEANLIEYLRNPRTFIPGNKMVFPGLKKDGEAETLVTYLRQAGPN